MVVLLGLAVVGASRCTPQVFICYLPMGDSSTYIGEHLLAGLTCVDAEGRVLSKLQVHGVITRNTENGIYFDQGNGEEFSLPPDLDSLQAVGPGNYTLRATGEVVVDPDFISSWTINAPG